MDLLKISAISYINTIPFIYGITKSGYLENYQLDIDIPSACADKLIADKVDIGLVPVATLPLLKEHYLVTDYCIGATGKVKTVLLLSQVPLKEIKQIHLDFESRTSVKLAMILAKHFWKINVDWNYLNEESIKDIDNFESIVAIGDKTFELSGKFQFTFDLCEEWQKFTSLPSVLACWVANKKLPQYTIDNFNKAIAFGVSNKIKAVQRENIKRANIDITEYITRYIDYDFNKPKQKALNLFLNYLKELALVKNVYTETTFL